MSFHKGKLNIMSQKNDPPASTPETDTESGAEGLDTPEDRERALYALTSMFERGLMSKDEYEQRKKELSS
ncbi:MAG: hypothetical protein AAF569_00680 [Pseudomonadota bacterium]